MADGLTEAEPSASEVRRVSPAEFGREGLTKPCSLTPGTLGRVKPEVVGPTIYHWV